MRTTFNKIAILIVLVVIAISCRPVKSALAQCAGVALPSAFFGATVDHYSTSFPLMNGMAIGTLGKEPGTTIKYIEPTSDCGSNPSSTCYHWGGLDNWVNTAHNDHMMLVYDLDSMPGWMCSNHNSSGNCAALPSNTAYITHFATALATRYKGRISYYETYNEVSNKYEWADSCSNLVYFHNLVRAAIKAADPGAKVAAPNMAMQGYQPACQSPDNVYPDGGTMLDVSAVADNFLKTKDRNGHTPVVDALGVHLYGVRSYAGCASGCYTLPTYGCNPQDQLDCASMKLLNVVNAFKSVAVKHGLTAPLLVTEGGFGSDTQASSNCPDYTTACLTGEQQAAYVGRWLVVLASSWADGHGTLPSWYGYDMNWGTLNGSYGMNPEDSAAYAQMEGWLKGATFTQECYSQGSMVLCQFTSGAGKPSMVIFNNANGATASWTPPSWASSMTPLTGSQETIPATVAVSDTPILVQ